MIILIIIIVQNQHKCNAFTMKAIKWAGTGASLLDPVYAHLIPPRYEDELPQAAESPNALGQDCGVLSASGAC